MRIFLKIAAVYFLATLPFAWQLSVPGRDVPDALLLGLRALYDVVMQLLQGMPTGIVPLGLFLFILFIGLTIVWTTESSRS